MESGFKSTVDKTNVPDLTFKSKLINFFAAMFDLTKGLLCSVTQFNLLTLTFTLFPPVQLQP